MKRLLMLAIIVFGILLMVLPASIRMLNDKPVMPGSEGYGHARIAGIIAKEGIPSYDPAVPERKYAINAFDLLLAGTAMLAGVGAAAVILPLVLGMLSILCVFAAVRKWKLPRPTAVSVMLVFVLSPFFVNTFAQATQTSLEVFLLSLLVFLLSPAAEKRPARITIIITIISIIIAGLVATFGIIPAAAAFVVPMLLRTLSKKVPAAAVSSSIAAFIVLVAVALPVFLHNEQVPFGKPVPVVQAISDFGGAGGLSLFAWLLAFIGFVLLWQFKKKYYAVMIAAGITLVAALIMPSALPAAHLLISFLAGYAFAFLAQRKWSFDDIRALTMLVLVCGLLFSTLAHCLALARGMPSNDIRESALAAKAVLPEDAVLLSHPDNGFWLEYWSGRQVFLDSWPAITPRIAQKWAAAQAIWHSQDITNARSLLFKNKIGAIVITEDMKNGLVWDLPEQDLLFLLRNNETFKKAYNSSSVDIWAVILPKM
ncbi:MAG: hypothetical protein QXM31_01005 [Candidatus Woesearchaeota archaeon]